MRLNSIGLRMWQNLFAYGLTVLLLATYVCGAQLTDYTIAPSTQVGYYHYPAPRRAAPPPPPPPSYYQQLPQQNVAPLQQQPPPLHHMQQQVHQLASRSNQYATQVPQQPRAQYQQPPQQQQQQHYQQQQPQQHQVHYQQQYQPQPQQQPRYHQPAASPAPSRPVLQQFMSPALDNVAFTAALTRQGYTFGNTAATSTSGASNANLHSANSVRLPLTLNSPLINVGPLPLMMGTPFALLQPDVTSYGTKDPQR